MKIDNHCPDCMSADTIIIDDIYDMENYVAIFCCDELRHDVMNDLYTKVNIK